MATVQRGGVRKATANTVTGMRRSAEARRCPACGRKSALVFISDEFGFGTVCRWTADGRCTYTSYTARDPAPPR